MGISVVGRISGILRSVKLCGRTMSSSSVNSPWLMLRPQIKRGDTVYRFYSLEEKKGLRFDKRGGGGGEMKWNEFVGSSHGWVALYSHLEHSLSLVEPVGGRHIELPPVNSLPDPEEFMVYGRSSRVILSCSPDENSEECRALMCYGPKRRLALCVPGRSDKWSPIDGHRRELVVNGKMRRFNRRRYESCVYSSRRKTLFCITEVRYEDRSGSTCTTAELEGWDLSDAESPRINWSVGPDVDSLERPRAGFEYPARSEEESWLKKYQCSQDKYLVYDEPSDQLFLVVRHVLRRVGPDGSFRPPLYYSKYRGWDDSYPHKTIDFDVFKIDHLQAPRLDKASHSLDGLAMFVGINHPFAVRPIGKYLKPNSIYFTDTPNRISRHYGGHDNGIFNYENRTFSPCHRTYPIHLGSGSLKQMLPPPLWYTPTPMPDLALKNTDD